MKKVKKNILLALLFSSSIAVSAQDVKETEESTIVAKSQATTSPCQSPFGLNTAKCKGNLTNRRVKIELNLDWQNNIRGSSYPFTNTPKVRLCYKRRSNGVWGMQVIVPNMLSNNGDVFVTIPSTGFYDFYLAFTKPGNQSNCPTTDPNLQQCISCITTIGSNIRIIN